MGAIKESRSRVEPDRAFRRAFGGAALSAKKSVPESRSIWKGDELLSLIDLAEFREWVPQC